ncbi:ubiquitin-related domain-containing protein [Flagelloscypha sp. PMI_526]|nr:ubiquitin-related domain-containing protein [Flagelloscypha sp. PMI_526]
MSGEPDEKPKISITIRHNTQDVTVKVRLDTKFQKVFNAAAKQFGKADASVFRFVYNGSRLGGEESPADHDMEDEDVVDAFLEQQGGSPPHSYCCSTP